MLWIALLTAAHAEDAWTTRDVSLVRWPEAVLEAAPVTAEVAEGDKVVILLEDGDQVRVRAGEAFGWVAADALTKESPEGEEEPAETPE